VTTESVVTVTVPVTVTVTSLTGRSEDSIIIRVTAARADFMRVAGSQCTVRACGGGRTAVRHSRRVQPTASGTLAGAREAAQCREYK
jgi:hypothetical protein